MTSVYLPHWHLGHVWSLINAPKKYLWDFPGGTAVKASPSSVWGMKALLWAPTQSLLGLSRAGVPNLQDLMSDDMRWCWYNNYRNKVHNKCDALESSWNHPLPPPVHGIKSKVPLVPLSTASHMPSTTVSNALPGRGASIHPGCLASQLLPGPARGAFTAGAQPQAACVQSRAPCPETLKLQGGEARGLETTSHEHCRNGGMFSLNKKIINGALACCLAP